MPSRVRERPNVYASLLMMAAFAVLFFMSLDFPRTARLFPQAIGLAGFALSTVQLMLDLLREPRPVPAAGGGDLRPADDLSLGNAIRSVRGEFLWLLGIVLGALVFGPIPAVLAYLLLSIGLRRGSWKVAALTTVAFAAFWLGVFGVLLGSVWPEGFVGEPQNSIVRGLMRVRGLF